MGMTIILIFSILAVSVAQGKVTLEADMPFMRTAFGNKAELKCCFKDDGNNSPNITWCKYLSKGFNVVQVSDRLNMTSERTNSKWCGILKFPSVVKNDTGLYMCLLPGPVRTHGTYLQVYKPVEKVINCSESAKNKILTAEGILLLLCVLGPSATLIFKSKKLNQLQRQKEQKEEENIYQGLNLDDCCTTYDQIERSQAHGPYQDVGNIKDEGEEIQLEKP
ncbi:B-cell antigen receptor complex-associated protein alpha chain [Mugil cephalus]|uniref:B-cell antigen receptor complex-associated protein alpha chain n=1 Tax=Mugil cephalus TaxID=48193 RepID=UPI001FB70228|nr:B-cell antigen receptor complex-associated protein alpha chain [Mugil cephalus]